MPTLVERIRETYAKWVWSRRLARQRRALNSGAPINMAEWPRWRDTDRVKARQHRHA